MKKILIYSGLVCILLSSCKKDLTSLNVDPKSPSTVPSYTLFTYAQKNLADNLSSANVNSNIWRLIMQYWTETTYTDESNYDLSGRNIPQNFYHSMYRDVLRDLQDSRDLIPTDVTDPVQIKNEQAIIDVLKIYTYHYLVTTFGNIPYTQALDISNTQPVFDDAKTIYSSLMTKLDGAIANMNTSGVSFGGADIVYGGDVSLWKKFAASLKLKMALVMADYDNTAAGTAAVAAQGLGLIGSNAQNADFLYLSTPPNTNPVWVDLVQSGRKDFVVTNTIITNMQTNNDPRLSLYCTVNGAGGYSGGVPGASNNYTTFSKPSATITDPAHPYTLMSYSEVEFLLAEAAARGYAVTGTAATHYASAVTASITNWGGSAAAAVTYLAQPAVVYNPANYKQSIGTQKWLSMFDRGHDAWTDWRRLDFPVIVAPPSALTVTPLRYTYPTTENTLNGTNYTAAAAAIGGDKVSTKLWFDKF